MKVRSTTPPAKAEGYIVIIVLLLTAVLLMLGLSLATRTTEEVYLSGQEADTTRVFNQAESGIEEGLSMIQSGTATVNSTGTVPIITPTSGPSNNTSYEVTGTLASTTKLSVSQGNVLTLKWVNGTVVRWIHASNCSNAAAIVATLYYIQGGTAKEAHLAYNPAGTDSACGKGSSFDQATAWSEGTSAGSTVTLNETKFGGIAVDPNTTALLRLRPLYADASFDITGTSVIELTSSATDSTVADAASKANRKIRATRTEPGPPAIFDYAIFSGGKLEK